MNRREFLRTAGGTAGGAAAVSAASGPAAGSAAGGEGEGGGDGAKPDFGGWLSDVGNYSGEVVDARGQDEVTIEVGTEGNGGNFAFSPPAVHVDNGATVVWEWTGEGGSHNVVNEGEAFESELTGEAGFTFEQTVEEDGIFNYFCSPHRGNGMKGAIVVGSDYPSISPDASTPLDPSHMGAEIHEHFVGVAVILAISVSLVFTFFTLKYGESAHTKGGNN